MNTNNPKVRVISAKEVEKINKNNVAYFTLTDGTVAVIKKDDQKKPTQENNNPKKEMNSFYQKYKMNNNININNNIQTRKIYKFKLFN